jgi:putative transposase
VPWSGFDLINAFNAWKRSPEAGSDEAGQPGLVWRDDICQQVFEEAAVDLGRALESVSAWWRGERRQAPEHARFQEEADGAPVVSPA